MMLPIAHHAGEELIVAATAGTGVVSTTLLVLRARLSELVRRRRRNS
jgi:hypothetical protein